MSSPRVRTGLDRLVADRFAPLRGRRIGLVTHPAAVDANLRHVAELIAAAPDVTLAALFGPEHGLFGTAQDLIGVGDAHDALAGVPQYSLYGDTVESLRPTPEQLRELDLLVIDLQDVGSRYYTFQATLLFCLEVAGTVGLPVLVLDRPNPLGGVAVEGPALLERFVSFVGPHNVATRHGLTLGELARLYQIERGLTVDLTVLTCDGWQREMLWPATGLPWVLPSPNMPTFETALVYPGQCLLEGTNLSEGRGTTRPFELCGFPGVDARELARRLNAEGWPGVAFRPVTIRPTFQKHAGQFCGGVQLHLTDPAAFQSVRTGLAVLAALRDAAGESFDWRREPYEFVRDRLAIDLLCGGDRERLALEAGQPVAEIVRTWEAEEEAFRKRRTSALLYP